MNQHHPVFQFLINIEYCDFLLEMQNVLLETLIHVRICYVSKLVAFCKTYQCFLLDFPLLFDTRKKKTQHLKLIKNCLVVGELFESRD